MNDHGLTKSNLIATLPVALQKDPSAVALAEAIANLLAQRPKEIEQLLIYPVIDRLDEQLLDILARDFKVDWWDYDYSLEEKRRTLKSSWRVHKTLGTKAAVDEAISAIYPDSHATPWFDYGGKPYHYRLEINATGTMATLEKQARVLDLARYYRSLRDRLDEIHYSIEAKAPATLRMGGAAAVLVCLPIPETQGVFAFAGTVRLGGAGGTAAVIPVPEGQSRMTFRSSLRLGGTAHSVIGRIPTAERKEE